MRRILFLGLLVVLAAPAVRAADEPDPEPPGADARKLQGDWEIVSLSLGGGREIKGQGWTMKLEKERMTMTVKGTQTGTWKIDVRKRPKHIDMTANLFGSLCIYKLDKDDLTIGCNRGRADRPKDFASAQVTMVLKRKK
jgi:uncharacterized protein (TIGR03067 family)